MKIALLGAGHIGQTIARLLAASGDYQVTVMDQNAAALARVAGQADHPVHPALTTHRVDSEDAPALLAALRAGGGHDAVRAENWLFQHGDPDSAQGLALRAQMRERFYPARREWKVMAAYQSNAMLVEALCGLSAL